MNLSNLSGEFFSQQLVYIDENIKDLTNLYLSSTPIQERIKHFFNLYVLEVEELMSKNSKKRVRFIISKSSYWYKGDGTLR